MAIESPVFVAELYRTLLHMSNGKTLEPQGLPAEFYKELRPVCLVPLCTEWSFSNMVVSLDAKTKQKKRVNWQGKLEIPSCCVP